MDTSLVKPTRIDEFLGRSDADATNDYVTGIGSAYEAAFEAATQAKRSGRDINQTISSQEACDIGDRIEIILGIDGIREHVATLLQTFKPEMAAVKLAESISLGHFGFFDKEKVLDLAMKAALAVVTDGVIVSGGPGITRPVIKRNGDGTQYLAIMFSGIGTVVSSTYAGFTLLVADKVRKTLGLEKYRVNSTGEDEIARFIEEIRTYEKEVGGLQFAATDESIEFVLRNIPVEVDGYPTEPVEVMLHRGLQRIKTDRLRGNVVRVLVDGIIGRAQKIAILSDSLQMTGWEWCKSIKEVSRTREPQTDLSYILDAKPGKPIICLPNVIGAFRLRYGRAPSSGMGSFGVHPAVLEILDYPITVGTQVKVSILNKVGAISVVDSLEPPLVRLRNGDVVFVDSIEEARRIKDQLDRVIHLGDLLVSASDFLTHTTQFIPSPFVEEWWAQEAKLKVEQAQTTEQELSNLTHIDPERLHVLFSDPLSMKPTFQEALALSRSLDVRLHPKFTYFWDLISMKDALSLRSAIMEIRADTVDFQVALKRSPEIKRTLEVAGVPHKDSTKELLVEGDHARALFQTLAPDKEVPLGAAFTDTLTLLYALSGIKLGKKTSSFVGLSMRKAEGSQPRKMKPPAHVIFPVNNKGGPQHDILHFSRAPNAVELYNRLCPSCGLNSPFNRCPFCDSDTRQIFYCSSCNKETEEKKCPTCKKETSRYATILPKAKELIQAASINLGLQPYPPLRGITRLLNRDREPEPLEKGILRQRHNLTVYKDGTVRFDAPNSPLTHFTPSQLHIPLYKLHELGYTTDVEGKPLESDDQVVELRHQDVILPTSAADHLKRLSNYIDDLLTRFHKTNAFYNVTAPDDLIGSLVVGISPRSSVGVVGRLIGFVDAQVCFAHPLWHSAKRRTCGGDVDSVTLLMDVFLNYAPDLCPDQVGGPLDTPAVIEPLVFPTDSTIGTPRIEMMSTYPLEFYIRTQESPSPKDIEPLISTLQSESSEHKKFLSGYHYTHPTKILFVTQRSVFASPGTMPDKINKQILVATKIQAADVNSLVSAVLENYIIRQLMDDLETYSSQPFRCKGCGERYRRPTLRGVCLTCGRELQPTMTLASLAKYAFLAEDLAKLYNISPITRTKITIALENLQLLSGSKKQATLSDFA